MSIWSCSRIPPSPSSTFASSRGDYEACDILIAITYALDAAHATGIIHRDLKPDNVFLVDGKHVKLLDFGIAKLTATDHPQLTADYTQPGQAMGTPRYIAPEQARGDAIDARTDIYSLGVMAFELICGRLPFVGDNAMELVAKHITAADAVRHRADAAARRRHAAPAPADARIRSTVLRSASCTRSSTRSARRG